MPKPKVIYNKLVTCPLSKTIIDKIVKCASRYEHKIQGIVEINIVSPQAIQRLNKQFRGKNRVTDVLSFAWQEEWGEKFFLPTTNQDKHLGQVYICFEKIKIQAKEFKVSARNECTRMIVHGLLHLVGYDHMYDKEAKKMFTLQEKIIAAVESKKITPDKEIFLNLV